MTTGAKLAAIAALVGESGRARMLIALMDGRALTATELAQLAGVSASTASGHLGKLTQAGLLAVLPQGRHRYFRLASPAVARLLEGIMVVASEPTSARPEPHVGRLLREARTCYDHLAGRLGVALADALVQKGAIELGDEAGRVTELGESFLQSFGISLEARRQQSRRLDCRPCLDWSERRFHLSGVLGSALLARTLELGWIIRANEGRAVSVTPKGRRGFSARFGVEA